jgi:hypothetical protein
MRMGMRRFTWLTDAFSKKLENHSRGQLQLHGLQLREDSQDHLDHASDGVGRYNLPLEHGRYRDDDGDDEAIKKPA